MYFLYSSPHDNNVASDYGREEAPRYRQDDVAIWIDDDTGTRLVEPVQEQQNTGKKQSQGNISRLDWLTVISFLLPRCQLST